MDYPLVLSIAGFIIVTCFAIIGFLLKNNTRKNEHDLEGLILITQNLKETSIELRSSIQYIQSNCAEKHALIDKRINDHSGTLKIHSSKIAVINSKLKIKEL